MGGVCTCYRNTDRVQAISSEAVVAKQSLRLSSVHDSTINRGAVSKELAAYLEENKAYMNRKITQLFLAAIEKPSEALTCIQLKLCQMKDSDWVHFSTLVTHGKDALQFMVWKTKLSTHGFDFLCSYFGLFTRLSTLTLEDIGLGQHKFSLFAESLKRLETLLVLNLAVNDIHAEHCEMLVTAFSALDSLTQINLDENHISDSGCALLQDNIALLPKLNTLSLRYNSITAQGVSSLLNIVNGTKGLKIFADGNEVNVTDLERLKGTDR